MNIVLITGFVNKKDINRACFDVDKCCIRFDKKNLFCENKF